MADYTVQAGDNLTKIAKAYGTTVDEICKANNIKDPDKINIGQVLVLGNATPEEPVAATAEDVEAKLAAQEARIAELEQQGVGDLIERDLTNLYEWGEEKVEQGKDWVKDKYEQGKEAVKGAYEATTEYVEEKYEQTKEAVKDGLRAADDFHDKVNDRINESVQRGYERRQKLDDKITEAMKFDIPEEEAPVDTSTMTPEERAAYNEQRIADLESRTVGKMVREGVEDAVTDAKEFHNKIVDKQHDVRQTIRSTLAGWFDKLTKFANNLFEVD